MSGLAKVFGGTTTRFATSTKNSNSKLTEQRLLIVNVVSARAIKSASGGKGSEPFIVLSLRDIAGREIKNESFSTKRVEKATFEPSWNEEFQFGEYRYPSYLFTLITS